MKFSPESDYMEWPDGKLVVIDMQQASPVAYVNVYESGDVWMKVQGCEACKLPSPTRCCGKCPFTTDRGCSWHFDKAKPVPSKPLVCIALPEITGKRTEDCSLIYKCVYGSMVGKYRRVCDGSNVFQESIDNGHK